VTVLAVWGALVTGAVYMLRGIRKVLHGPLPERWMLLSEHSWPLRRLPYLILLACLVVFGFFPHLLVDRIKPDAERITMAANAPAPQAAAVTEMKGKEQ
jgi:NADH:ubiquinone oxidoreductase subunit 4 (subunit M)